MLKCNTDQVADSTATGVDVCKLCTAALATTAALYATSIILSGKGMSTVFAGNISLSVVYLAADANSCSTE